MRLIHCHVLTGPGLPRDCFSFSFSFFLFFSWLPVLALLTSRFICNRAPTMGFVAGRDRANQRRAKPPRPPWPSVTGVRQTVPDAARCLDKTRYLAVWPSPGPDTTRDVLARPCAPSRRPCRGASNRPPIRSWRIRPGPLVDAASWAARGSEVENCSTDIRPWPVT